MALRNQRWQIWSHPVALKMLPNHSVFRVTYSAFCYYVLKWEGNFKVECLDYRPPQANSFQERDYKAIQRQCRPTLQKVHKHLCFSYSTTKAYGHWIIFLLGSRIGARLQIRNTQYFALMLKWAVHFGDLWGQHINCIIIKNTVSMWCNFDLWL